jgi:hypothetical protein
MDSDLPTVTGKTKRGGVASRYLDETDRLYAKPADWPP